MGDQCSKEFFESHQEKRTQVMIKELVKEDKVLHTQKELLKSVPDFYKTLYTADPLVENNDSARNRCLESVTQVVSQVQNLELTAPIALAELHAAVKEPPTNKTPETDGIPIEFFQSMWKDIGTNILAFTEEVLEQGELTSILNTGLITLISKSHEIAYLTNFCPITLLPAMYKIIAKLLSKCMTQHLTKWIVQSHLGFVPGRCIFDNIYLPMKPSLEEKKATKIY